MEVVDYTKALNLLDQLSQKLGTEVVYQAAQASSMKLQL
jgi:hypothetical protein